MAKTALKFDPELIESRAGSIDQVDFIVVFGTAHPTPAYIATELFLRGLAPFVVVTGGENRARPGLVEAEAHQALLIEGGVPDDAIVAECESKNTLENARFAAPLILGRCPSPRSALAVVKWYHRRAVVTLARELASLERIFVADYEPSFDGDRAVTRLNWSLLAPHSIERETSYMRQFVNDGVDVLVRSQSGWVRSDEHVSA